MKSSLRPLTLAGFLISAVLFHSAPSVAQNKDAVDTSPIEEETRQEKSLLHPHKPFYFAYGEPLTKVQVSFKLRMLENLPLYFGYTQLMFWALKEHSVPFRDLTYNPELFYRQKIDSNGVFKSLDIGLNGHNSNGKDGDASRSYNLNYLRANLQKDGHTWNTRAHIQVQALRDYSHHNKDIQDYIGPLALNLTFTRLFDGWFDKSEIALDAVPGGKWMQHVDLGGYQLSWSFRLGGIYLTPAFYLQYYHGYAETLLNYDKKVDVVRGGIRF